VISQERTAINRITNFIKVQAYIERERYAWSISDSTLKHTVGREHDLAGHIIASHINYVYIKTV